MMSGLTESEEEYLEAIYRLKGYDRQVKVSELAKNLDVTEPSVVEMLKKLENKGFLDYERYAGVKLTEKGVEEGMRVIRRHRLAERLLCDVLDRDISQVHEEACRLEHSVANETADEIARVLDGPTTCPHGNPIPDGEPVMDEDAIKLTEGEEGEEYIVLSIPEEREDIQRLLPLAILPGSEIELAEKPSLSALMIKRGEDRLALGRDIASKIMVKPCEKRKRYRHRARAGR